MARHGGAVWFTLLAAAVALAGCGLAPDYGKPKDTRQEAGERIGKAAKPKRGAPSFRYAARPQRRPGRAVALFAKGWVNWSYRTVERQQLWLAALATGGLARGLEDNAAAAARDRSLRRDRAGNVGAVAAVDVKGSGPRRRFIVVCREAATAAGRLDLEGRRYRVYLGEVVAAQGGWAIARWQPQL